MQQKNFLEISLVVSLFGILLLLFLSNIIKPPQVSIDEINNKLLNQKIKVQGTIFKIQDKGSFKILSISDSTEKINVLCNCKDNLKIQDKILIIGTIQEYQKNLQISADKIIKSE